MSFISSLGRFCRTHRSDDPEYELQLDQQLRACVQPSPSETVDAEETTQNPVEIFSSRCTSTVSDEIAKMLDNLKNIKKETERVAMLTKRMMETPLLEPPMVVPPIGLLRNAVDEHDAPHCLGSWKMLCTWLQVRGRLRGAPDCMDGVRDGHMGYEGYILHRPAMTLQSITLAD